MFQGQARKISWSHLCTWAAAEPFGDTDGPEEASWQKGRGCLRPQPLSFLFPVCVTHAQLAQPGPAAPILLPYLTPRVVATCVKNAGSEPAPVSGEPFLPSDPLSPSVCSVPGPSGTQSAYMRQGFRQVGSPGQPMGLSKSRVGSSER